MTPRGLCHRCCAELSSLQNPVTTRQAHPDWDAQNVAISLQSWQCRMDELGLQADGKALNQLLGTNPGSPSYRRIIFLCVGLVLSLAVSWQGVAGLFNEHGNGRGGNSQGSITNCFRAVALKVFVLTMTSKQRAQSMASIIPILLAKR